MTFIPADPSGFPHRWASALANAGARLHHPHLAQYELIDLHTGALIAVVATAEPHQAGRIRAFHQNPVGMVTEITAAVVGRHTTKGTYHDDDWHEPFDFAKHSLGELIGDTVTTSTIRGRTNE